MKLGRIAEGLACEYLMRRGQTVIERNCRRGRLEIDIITLDKNGVHFVEVKSRMAPVAAAPQENVTARKQKKVAEAALRYLNTTKDARLEGGLEVNFDIVAVTFEAGRTKVDYFPNAYIPLYV